MFATLGTDGASPRRVRLASPRGALLALLAAVAASAVVALCLAQAAGAVVTNVAGRQFGVQPETHEETPAIAEPLAYEGGPVVYSTAPYALYWDHSTGEYFGSWEELISGFLQDAGNASGALSNDFAVVTQYHDTTLAKSSYAMTFRGAYTDTDAYPTSGNCSEGARCLTDAQVRAELTSYIAANGMPTGLNPSGSPTPIYYVFTPPGVTICLQGSGERGNCSSQGSAHPLCSYHSYIPAGGSLAATVLYVVEPWTAGNYGMLQEPLVSGSGCQDGTATMQEPNQIGLGPEGRYSAGLADLIVNNVADEALSTVTNPLLNAWHDAGDAKEVVDKCRNDFYGGELTEAPGPSVQPHTLAGLAHNQTIVSRAYYLNDVFDQAAYYAAYPGVPCINHVNVSPAFTAQNTIRSGDVATFNTTESDISLGIQKYVWNFGDGTGTEANCEQRVPTNGYEPQECTSQSGIGLTNPVASTDHVYTYGGNYQVTLTVTDYAGNTATVTHAVNVTGPPPPSSGPTGGGGTNGGGTASPASAANGSSTTTGSSTTAGAAPAVVASQAVVSQSLASALRGGLVVNYSVNEQAAGRFEVLLASSTARRIGLRGAAATGLPKGAPAQTVIAKAILVTTKGGRSTYKIKFDKATARKLRRLGRVTLTIRMTVHNAKGAAATTVLNTVNLR